MARKKVAQLAKVLDGKDGLCFHVGMDVHKKSYSMAFLREDGALHTFVAPAEPERVVAKIREVGIKVAGIVYEAGPTGFGLARALLAAGLPVTVVAPSKVPRPVTRDAKTDRLDCIKLAQYAARGMLSSIAIPTGEEEAERSLARRRQDLTRSIRCVKQRIRSHLLFLGVHWEGTWSGKGVESLKSLVLQGPARLTLDSLVRELTHFVGERKLVVKEIAAITRQEKHREVIGNLMTVPGVGEGTASVFCLEIFRPDRFEDSGQLASFLGLAPMVHQSGEGKARGSLVPTGQKRLRSLLVESAWRWQAKDQGAREYYRRRLSRTNLPKKAIVAVARKLAIILWRLATENRPYEARAMAA